MTKINALSAAEQDVFDLIKLAMPDVTKARFRKLVQEVNPDSSQYSYERVFEFLGDEAWELVLLKLRLLTPGGQFVALVDSRINHRPHPGPELAGDLNTAYNEILNDDQNPERAAILRSLNKAVEDRNSGIRHD